MKRKFLLIAILCVSFLTPQILVGQNPFLKKLERKAKRKMEQRAERKADQAMDKGLDKVEEAVSKSGKKNESKSKEKTSSSSSGDAVSTRAEAESMENDHSPQVKTPSQEEEKVEQPQSVFSRKTPTEPEPFPNRNFGNEKITDQGEIGKGPFGIPSGKFIQITKVKHEMMESIDRDTVYFAKYGHLQARYTSSQRNINMMGMKRKEASRMIAVHRNDSIYSFEPPKRTGHVLKNPSTQLYQGMTEKDLENFVQEFEQNMNTQKKRLGTEQVAGKLCEVFEFTTYSDEGKVMVITRMWWWQGMMMKSLSRGMGTETEQITTLMDDKARINNKLFVPHPSVNFQRFDLGKY